MRLQPAILLLGAFFATSPLIAADRGFYAGAGVGQMNVEIDDVYDLGINFDEDDVGFKVFGGYRFLPWLSVEGIYLDGGKPETQYTSGADTLGLTVEVQTIAAAAVFSLPIGDQFEIFLKPGFAYWDSTADFRVSSPDFSYDFSDDDSGNAFFIGAGAGWTIGKVALRLEYEMFDVAPEYNSDTEDFEDELDATSTFISLSAMYLF
jgi:OOP family OmpA-OmpF porin